MTKARESKPLTDEQIDVAQIKTQMTGVDERVIAKLVKAYEGEERVFDIITLLQDAAVDDANMPAEQQAEIVGVKLGR